MSGFRNPFLKNLQKEVLREVGKEIPFGLGEELVDKLAGEFDLKDLGTDDYRSDELCSADLTAKYENIQAGSSHAQNVYAQNVHAQNAHVQNAHVQNAHVQNAHVQNAHAESDRPGKEPAGENAAGEDAAEEEPADTMKETDKKCPSCGGVMNFDPATGGLHCPYCEHTEAIVPDKAMQTGGSGGEAADELDFAAAEQSENCDWGVKTKAVICKACGAESIYDALQIAAVCPFCGSNQVMAAADRNTMAPGGVVPFKVSDKQASVMFTRWIKRKWFCPKLAKESAKANNFNGVYLPYWTFDSKTVSQYWASYGVDRVEHDDDGKSRTVTSWYSTSGTYNKKIDDELVTATVNHNQSMLQGLEPFETAANKRYKPEYIAGFVAERYAIGLKEAWQHARESIRRKLVWEIEKKIKMEESADQVRNLKLQTEYFKITYKYLLLPIWISNYKYKDKIYNFMVNGQTGKVAGKIPISPFKVAITAVAVIAATALAAWLWSQF